MNFDGDAAFEAGLRQAIERGSGLLLMLTRAAGRHAWLCAYPPASIGAGNIAEWARGEALAPADGDRFLTVDDLRAAIDALPRVDDASAA